MMKKIKSLGIIIYKNSQGWILKDRSLSRDFWKDADTLWNFGTPKVTRMGKLTKVLAIKKISEAIASTPNFKSCGPDAMSMEFFKVLIPGKGESEESSEYNSNISSGFLKYLEDLIHRIWNGDFPFFP